MRNGIIGILLLASASLHAQNNVIDEVVWVVGEEAILKSEVEQSRIEMQSMGQRMEGDPYCVIPEQLAIQKLFLHQAAIDSVEVTDATVGQDVEARINFYIQQIGSREKVEEYFGKTLPQIRETLFDLIKNEKMIDEVKYNLVKDIKVTPAQVRRFYKEQPEDSIPFIPTMYEVQLMTISPKVAPAEIERVKNLLRDITEQVNSGKAQFSSMALRYSEDRESASHGGELGFSSRSNFVPEFSAVAFNLTDPKTVSKIVETEYGFHIIQMIEKRGDRMNVRHILIKPRVSDDELVAALNQMDSILVDINNKKYTFEEAVYAYSSDKETRSNYGIMVNSSRESDYAGTSRFELKDLPSEVAKQVSGMSVGDTSKPFIMVNSKGKEVVAVVRLKNRINGHRATMQDDYQQLQDLLVAKLNEERVEEWIREMQQKTYIRINDDWRNCEFKYPGWIKE
ncbi:MAG: peptidylprolyl isomerase [Bacteroidales bacterium]|nr:peptidylprolyl isomerase [Bacteroidales bacterium]